MNSKCAPLFSVQIETQRNEGNGKPGDIFVSTTAVLAKTVRQFLYL